MIWRRKIWRGATARSRALALAGGGIEQAGEHLERGGLARAVGPQETDHLARLDGERDLVHGFDGAVGAVEQAPDGGLQPGLAVGTL